jgi:hypothetical protein
LIISDVNDKNVFLTSYKINCIIERAVLLINCCYGFLTFLVVSEISFVIFLLKMSNNLKMQAVEKVLQDQMLRVAPTVEQQLDAELQKFNELDSDRIKNRLEQLKKNPNKPPLVIHWPWRKRGTDGRKGVLCCHKEISQCDCEFY